MAGSGFLNLLIFFKHACRTQKFANLRADSAANAPCREKRENVSLVSHAHVSQPLL